MTMIQVESLENGAHNNQTVYFGSVPIPEGWAIIPEDVGTPETLENFPFGEITVEDVDGVPTVTSWTPLAIPEPEPDPEPEPTDAERLRADVDFLYALDGVEL